MKRLFGLALVGGLLTLTALAQGPAGGLAAGTWQLSTLAPMGTEENTTWLFTLEKTEDKITAKVLSTSAKGTPEVVSFKVDGDKVKLVVKGAAEETFEGQISKDGKKIVGVFGNSKGANAAYMAASDMTTIPKKGAKQKLKGAVQDLKNWAEISSPMAQTFGHNAIIDVNCELAMAFLAKSDAALAAKFAMIAEKANSAKDGANAERLKVLRIATRALKDAGMEADLAPMADRLEKMELVVDKEYHATVPPFKGKVFAGRKSESKRVVVMELFTGAQCPPCVAADVAFDVLQKTYKTNEVALIQYHLHIPGADPMTNSDTEARAKYYKVNSTPSTLFDGVSKAGGGGGMAAAEKKYEAYRKVIEPLLDEPAGCHITASAKRVNNKVEIQTSVSGLEKPGANFKLRLVLVEENIRFVGVNNLRFHHQVVRAMPGGVAGVSLTNPQMTFKNEVNLTDLRKQLTKYLDNYNLTGARAPFPQVPRPLDFNGLRVIALVQDDTTHDILQAVQVDVKE
ncbi:MAG TPA: hypothetical protein VE988_26690 [Gemmataceae bacterium]|nr:hypothetical protein [Gemmataceae bacterium]